MAYIPSMGEGNVGASGSSTGANSSRLPIAPSLGLELPVLTSAADVAPGPCTKCSKPSSGRRAPVPAGTFWPPCAAAMGAVSVGMNVSVIESVYV